MGEETFFRRGWIAFQAGIQGVKCQIFSRQVLFILAFNLVSIIWTFINWAFDCLQVTFCSAQLKGEPPNFNSWCQFSVNWVSTNCLYDKNPIPFTLPLTEVLPVMGII